MVDCFLWAGISMYLSAFILNMPKIVNIVRATSRSWLWLAFAWILAFWGLAVFNIRSNDEVSFNNLDSSAVYQVVMFGLSILILLGLAIRRSIIHDILRVPVITMAIYGVLGIVTAVISPAPLLSAYKGALILMDVLFVLVSLSHIYFIGVEYKSFLLSLSYFLLSLMVFGAALGGVLVPEISRHAISGIFGYQLYGQWPFLNPNELGFLSAITGIISLRRFFRKKPFSEKYYWFALFFLSTVVLVIAQARTSVASFALSVIVLSIFIQKMRWIAVFALLIVVGTITYSELNSSSIEWIDIVGQYSTRGLSQKQLTTMSGRTELWEDGFKMFLDSPVFGHGYDAGVRIVGQHYGVGVAHLHNAHFQVLANSGILGFSFWFIMVMSVTWKTFRLLFHARWPLSTEADCLSAENVSVLIIILVRTFTGQVLVTHQYSLLIFVAIIVFVVSSERFSLNIVKDLN